MVAIIYDVATRQILAINPERRADQTVIMPVGVAAAAVDISQAEVAKFAQPGSFVLDPDGQTVVVTPPGPNPVETERSGALVDLQGNYAADTARLNDIVSNGNSYTAAQSRDALIDLARIIRRDRRWIRALLT